MARGERARAIGRSEGWYRKPRPWLLAGALVLPFGWLLPLCRLAWVRVAARRAPRKAAAP